MFQTLHMDSLFLSRGVEIELVVAISRPFFKIVKYAIAHIKF